MVEGNDIRALAAGTERWYGQIRLVDEDPYLNTWQVSALGKEVKAHDLAWSTRREWVNLPPEVIIDEVLGNKMDEELRGGQILFYDMETLTDAGLMEDLSPEGNDGTINGAISAVANWGLGRSFAGAEDITAPHSTAFEGLTAFSVAGFASPDDVEDGGCIFDSGGRAAASDQGFNIHRTTGANAKWRGQFFSPAGTSRLVDSLADVAPGFTHVCLTYDGAVLRLYLNGIEDNTLTFAGTPSLSTTESHFVGQLSDNIRHWDGILNQIQVFNFALSPAQVLAIAGRSIYEGGLLSEGFDPISFRAEEDSRLNIVDEVTKVIGAEWFTDRDANDKDRFRVIGRRGSSTPTDTFQLGVSVMRPIKHELDRETVRNDVIVNGYGDGQNQIRSRIFHATTIRSTISLAYPAASTGPISVFDTSAFPVNGTVFLGMERVAYAGKSATQLGTGSVVRASETDGYESLEAYNHSKGIAVWLHRNAVTTPPTYFDPSSPQTGSSIADNGQRQGPPFVDRGIIDQDTLDFLAQRLLATYLNPRDSVRLRVQEEDIAAEVGDDVTLLDLAGAPLFASPYRLFAYKFERRAAIWDLDLGSPRDVTEAELARIREELRLSRSYGQGATNEYTVPVFDNILGPIPPTGIPLVLIFETPKDAKAVNEVRVLKLTPLAFRGYTGAPNIARTTSELAAGPHSHLYNRPVHTHGTAGTLDIPDATTSEDGTPPHTHPVTYVAHAIAAHAGEDPAQQQTNTAADGVGHTHGGNVGPHSHGAPAAGSAQASIGGGGSVDIARPDQDVSIDAAWIKSGCTLFFQCVDEVTPDGDTTRIQSDTDVPANAWAEFGLGDLDDPLSSSGHIMRINARSLRIISDGQLDQIEFQLLEGATIRKSVTISLSHLGYGTFSTTLSGAEADAIGDYTDLRLRVRASQIGDDEFVRVTQMEFEIPPHSHAVPDDNHTHGTSDATDLGNPLTDGSAVAGTHDHDLNPDGAGHVHGLPNDGQTLKVTGTNLGHTHTWTIADHDHLDVASLDEPILTVDAEDDALHDHGMQGHTHVAGIFETAYSPVSMGIRIDGTDRTAVLGGPFTVEQTDIDITEFVRTIGKHTIEFFETVAGQIGRIYAAVLIKFFIQSGTGG